MFTISADGKNVHFSRGNLRYTVGNPGVWSFFDNQYDCGSMNYSDGHNNEISLFTWGYNATLSIIPDGDYTYNVSEALRDLSQEQDWGCKIGDGKTWRTLTREEWQYLFNKDDKYGKTCRSDKYKWATALGLVSSMMVSVAIGLHLHLMGTMHTACILIATLSVLAASIYAASATVFASLQNVSRAQ